MSIAEVACSYAIMILHDDGIPITGEKIATFLKSANVKVDSLWPRLFAKLAEKKDVIGDLIMNPVGSAEALAAMTDPATTASVAAPMVEEKKKEEEPEEGSDDDMSLFDLFE
uniref:60S acidic ribosomal protein P1-like n=1 Tax=Fragaria vesca subsp. vesca TaxID=101020 RepID=UPI0005C9E86F|nr:PREDICTED: 60S acidic ribosomal protein P1-like [Fragaria vesca subsp. vesca]